MIALLEGVSFWVWLGLGVLLLVLEVLGAGGYLLWIGLSAATVGVIKWVVPGMGWETQWLTFALLSLATAVGWWYAQRNRAGDASEGLNQRGRAYIGREFELWEPIRQGRGKIRVDDSFWSVSGEDLPKGTLVKVVGLEDLVLRVEAVRR
ncbi:NfeD family protein [Aestuariirhabdus litorea]|uniref:NfeD family protein n=1 Tax=Aestuariirhabdus litorea TaxID=2528527 RepID=A0A3P3VI23_9GAMM|nr:NfeD family protein [Aestuariirhabdus litorea]RRJ82370.1 NfeD family protein [Aestuariirhabdus litorea]RWW92533.1 NfeD family protein [Endozoicomonadaceae bacterium GTF-13]